MRRFNVLSLFLLLVLAGRILTAASTPVISSFTPTSGVAGTSVSLTGTGFTGATAVKFNGKAASSFSVVNATTVTAVAPTGVTTGKISVTTSGGTGTSAVNFTVIPAPTITGFTPTAGTAGTTVTITGTNFTGATAVKFSGTVASSYTVVSSTSIAAAAPIGVTTGKLSVTTAGGTATSSLNFTVVAVPTITGFAPSSGGPGVTVTLTGTNFTGATAVKFNGAAASSFGVTNSTSMTAVAPTGVTSGPLSVTTSGGTATSSSRFAVVPAPAIAGFAPTIGSVGTPVVIAGANFTGATAVKFNGIAASSFSVDSATSITALAPSGVTTGAISVAAPGGTATSSTSFTVVNISISPMSSTVAQGANKTFTATVTGTSNTSVTWSATGGSISTSGVYTAPSTAGTFTVTAASVADPSKSAVATVTVPMKIAIAPASTSVLQGGEVFFSATVTGSSDSGVTWSATKGVIDPNGHFIAPNSAGAVTVTATTMATPAASANATVTVQSVGISVYPASQSVVVGDQVQFNASVTGTVNSSVTWSVTGGGAGTIDSQGYYTAPATTGTYTIQAASVTDPTKITTATVTVTPNTNGLPEFQFASSTPGQVQAGQSFTITWGVSGATSVTMTDPFNKTIDVTGQSSISVDATAFPFWDTFTYLLQATNANGTLIHYLNVPSAYPEITLLSADKNVVDPGGTVKVTAVYSGGQGRLEPGLGAISSGQTSTIPAMGTPNERLVVQNDYGRTAEAAVVNRQNY